LFQARLWRAVNEKDWFMRVKFLILLFSLLALVACEESGGNEDAQGNEFVEAEFDESDPLAFAPGASGGGVQLDCTPSCDGMECGPDGCGGSCGGCPSQSVCGAEGVCVAMSYEDGTCHALAPCVLTCDGDEECALGCAEGATQTVVDEMTAVLNCSVDHCGDCANEGEMEWACNIDCMIQACPTEYVDCMTGDLGCWNISHCIKGCSDDDEDCAPTCFGLGTLSSQQVWVNIFFCIYDVCGDNPTEDCKADAMKGECHDLVVECLVM